MYIYQFSVLTRNYKILIDEDCYNMYNVLILSFLSYEIIPGIDQVTFYNMLFHIKAKQPISNSPPLSLLISGKSQTKGFQCSINHIMG